MTKSRILASLCGTHWRSALQELTDAGYEVVHAHSLSEHCELLKDGFDLVIAGASGTQSELLKSPKSFGCKFLVAATGGSEELAIQAMRAGASDYVKLPCPTGALLASARRCLPSSQSTARLTLPPECRLIGRSFAMASVIQRAHRVAASKANVLLTGETGTGKELVAELIHLASQRAAQRFVAINCAAIPEALLESELFGYERGAFTGANQSRVGKLEYARGGTVFLDEIGDMNLFAQTKILRALESQKVQRLGDHRDRDLDIRIVAATHRDLERLAAKGEFRQDLFFRLNVVHLRIPALRERAEDIAPLFQLVVQEAAASQGKPAMAIMQETLDAVCAYQWPGNVRELRNSAEWAVTFCEGGRIAPVDLPERVRGTSSSSSLRLSEREQILFALNSSDWNKSAAARQLKCSRMTLYRKIERHGIAIA